MLGKLAIAVAAASALLLAAASSPALAFGFGHGHGAGNMWLLARAAGLDHSQIASAFHNDANLKTDRASLMTAHQALMSCLVSGDSCTSQVSAFSTALQTLAQERMTVWQNLFKSAPDLSRASSIYAQLQQLHTQRKQILRGIIGSGSNSASASGGNPSHG